MTVSETPPRRLSRSEQQALTRTRIIDAADAVFTERGFQNATLEQIAEQAGYTRGAVYSNFKGKDELALEIIERRVALVKEVLVKGDSSGADPLGEAKELGMRVAELIHADRPWGPLFLEFAIHASRRADVGERLRATYRGLAATVTAVVEQAAHSQGVAPPLPPERLALLLLAATDGVSLERLIDPERADPQLMGEMVELLLRGVLAKSADS